MLDFQIDICANCRYYMDSSCYAYPPQRLPRKFISDIDRHRSEEIEWGVPPTQSDSTCHLWKKQWKPMGTAPKDGQTILVRIKNGTQVSMGIQRRVDNNYYDGAIKMYWNEKLSRWVPENMEPVKFGLAAHGLECWLYILEPLTNSKVNP